MCAEWKTQPRLLLRALETCEPRVVQQYYNSYIPQFIHTTIHTYHKH